MTKGNRAPRCKLCGAEHWLNEGHLVAKAASNGPSRASNRPVSASNRVLPASNAVLEIRPEASIFPGEAMAKQRWARKAYNAYMKEYMQRRRQRGNG